MKSVETYYLLQHLSITLAGVCRHTMAPSVPPPLREDSGQVRTQGFQSENPHPPWEGNLGSLGLQALPSPCLCWELFPKKLESFQKE